MSANGKTRHVPMRMCVICRRRLPKRVLLRFVASEGNGALLSDPRQVLPGRGRYICSLASCREKFGKKGAGKGKRGLAHD